jgi:hypothetical protein
MAAVTEGLVLRVTAATEVNGRELHFLVFFTLVIE